MFWDWNHNGKYDAFDEFIESEIADDIDRELSKPIDPYDYIDKDFDEENSFDDDDFESDDYDDDDESTVSFSSDIEPLNINIPIKVTFSWGEKNDEDEAESNYQDAFCLKREDFPNERTYLAASKLEDISEGYGYYETEEEKQQMIERCNFILNDECLASKYLSLYSGFIYAQAVKEHFQLPIELPDEDDKIKTYFSDLIKKIAWKDRELSIKVWEWCYDNFYEHRKYGNSEAYELIRSVLASLDSMPKDYAKDIVKYIHDNPDFSKKIIADADELAWSARKLVSAAIETDVEETAVTILKDAAICAENEPEELYRFVNAIYWDCYEDEVPYRMFFFAKKLLPVIENVQNEEIQKYVESWKASCAEYLAELDNEGAGNCKQNNNQNLHVKIITYYGVQLSESKEIEYFYSFEGEYEIGDLVLVDTDVFNKTEEGMVVSIFKCVPEAEPDSLKFKTKFIRGEA